MKTAESVAKGHPDKICDQISDAILDACLSHDPDSRVAVETMGGHGKIAIMGEITSKYNLSDGVIQKIAQCVLVTNHYLNYEDYTIDVNIVKQSPDIAMGVDNGGAGDQGIMVGYACDDNEQMIPQELYLARRLVSHMTNLTPLGPDGKGQVTLNDDGSIETVVLSFQKPNDISDFPKDWAERVLKQKIKNYYFNPTGSFVIGGFDGDTGLTGRKLAVDNYGPNIPIGGGAKIRAR